jgi:pachytene checkpoint protein 2
VLIDEVESFAVRRSLASFETNPVDVQRATDAVLAGCAPRPPRPTTPLPKSLFGTVRAQLLVLLPG